MTRELLRGGGGGGYSPPSPHGSYAYALEQFSQHFSHFSATFQGADNWHWHWPEPEDIPTPAQPSLPEIQMPLPPLESTALVDVSNRSIGGGLVGHAYTIPQDDVDCCLITCKSRRNLAGQQTGEQHQGHVQ